MSRGNDHARRQRARQVVNGAKGLDLSAAKMSDDQAWRVQAELELAMGMRCHGCGRRVTVGLRFVSIDVRDGQRPAVHRVACNRTDCNFAELARDGATVMEMIEWAWLDELGADGPAFGLGMASAAAPEPERVCRSCGCTEGRACVRLDASGLETCSWAPADGEPVCTACIGESAAVRWLQPYMKAYGERTARMSAPADGNADPSA